MRATNHLCRNQICQLRHFQANQLHGLFVAIGLSLASSCIGLCAGANSHSHYRQQSEARRTRGPCQRVRHTSGLAVATQRARPDGSFFMQSFVAIMLNPKMHLLFGTLIPPFIPQGADVFKYTMVMGLIFMALAAAGDTTYALLAGRAGAFLSHKRIRGIEIISGCCLLAGAAWMVLKGH